MEKTPEQVWNECLEIIRDNVSRQSFRTWFSPLKALRLEVEGSLLKLTVKLPSRFYFEWLEEHYFGLLRKTITKVLGANGRLFYDIVIEKDDAEKGFEGTVMQLPARQPANEPQPLPAAGAGIQSSGPGLEFGQRYSDIRGSGLPVAGGYATPVPVGPPGIAAPISNPFVIPGVQKVRIDPHLNPNYTFDRFIEGDCNRLARSASLAIAQQPGGTSFNPFLLYGGVGLGKTHLIQAIGNYLHANRPDANILYVSSERFTNEFVQAIQNNRVSDFSLFYRQIDLLVIDDVQFFSGKEKTQ